MSELDDVLASIDGALADDEFPDAMRWSPEPETVADARAPFDGETVWVGPEEPSSTFDPVLDFDPALPISPRNFPRITTTRGGIRFARPPEPGLRDLGLVEVVFPPDEEQRAAARRLHERDRAAADRARARADLQRARRHTPRPPRGPASDLVLFDETFLVDPAHRDEVREAMEAGRQALLAGLSIPLAPLSVTPPGPITVPPGLLRPPTWTPSSVTVPETSDQIVDAWDALRSVFDGVIEALQPVFDSLVEAARAAFVEPAKFIREFTEQALQAQTDRPPPPLPDLRRVDPKAYALQLRQSRNTGPDRQVQRQPRPRRHLS